MSKLDNILEKLNEHLGFCKAGITAQVTSKEINEINKLIKK